MTTHGQQIVLAARPQRKPVLTDFRLEDTTVPTPATGQLLLEVQYLSLDPSMRGRMNEGESYAPPLQIGEVSGTPAGDLFGVPPHTGKSFRIMAIDIQTIRDGKIARAYHLENWLSALGQLRAK